MINRVESFSEFLKNKNNFIQEFNKDKYMPIQHSDFLSAEEAYENHVENSYKLAVFADKELLALGWVVKELKEYHYILLDDLK